jgi:hypothetical protein
MPGGILDEGAPAVLEVPEPAHPLNTRAIAARAEREERDFILSGELNQAATLLQSQKFLPLVFPC